MQRKQAIYKDDEPYWQCSKCKRWLLESGYYADKKSFNRLKTQCKKCHIETGIKTRDRDNSRRINREYMRRLRQTNPGKFRVRDLLANGDKTSAEKIKARFTLSNALAAGKIIKPSNCSQCGKIRKLAAHHEDYSKALEVKWLCYKCHANL